MLFNLVIYVKSKELVQERKRDTARVTQKVRDLHR